MDMLAGWIIIHNAHKDDKDDNLDRCNLKARYGRHRMQDRERYISLKGSCTPDTEVKENIGEEAL